MRHFVHLLWRPLEEVIRSEGEKYLNENLLGVGMRFLLGPVCLVTFHSFQKFDYFRLIREI